MVIFSTDAVNICFRFVRDLLCVVFLVRSFPWWMLVVYILKLVCKILFKLLKYFCNRVATLDYKIFVVVDPGGSLSCGAVPGAVPLSTASRVAGYMTSV